MSCSMLRHAAACFKTPANRPQKQVLRHASIVGACMCPSASKRRSGARYQATTGNTRCGDGMQFCCRHVELWAPKFEYPRPQL